MERTISFVKGKGSINHNNCEFITDYVDRDRIKDNIVYVRKKLSIAYEEFFGEAVKEYDEKQKRKDRQYGSVKNYITSLENSKNGKKLFYENIVQIGDMTDSGCGTPEGKVCADILNEYALTFQERNPNLQVINI